MTQTQRVAYNFFVQTVLLLLVYAAVHLVNALSALYPELPQRLTPLANLLLHLTMLSGLIGGGVYITTVEHIDYRLTNETLLTWTSRLWTIVIIAAFPIGLSDQPELLRLLDLAQVVVILSTLFNVASARSRTRVVIVWWVGMGLSVLCKIAVLMDRNLQAFAAVLNLNVAYTLSAAAIAFWLMRRFSNVQQWWADTGLRNVAVMLTVAGVLLGTSAFDGWQTSIGAFLISPLYWIFAAHSYRALSDRNPTLTLAAHWYALAVLLFLLGPGTLGAARSVPDIARWTENTRIEQFQEMLTAFAIIAVLLSLINQAVAELRGHNQRITGLMPFWLVTFGIVAVAIGLGGIGLIETYQRVLALHAGTGLNDVQRQAFLVPLYTFWVLGSAAVMLGVGVYALGFWVRRPTKLRS